MEGGAVLDIRANLGQPEEVLRPLAPDSRGILRTPADDSWKLDRWEPSEALRPYVCWHWAVQWALGDRSKHEQATLPHPSAHLVVEAGAATLRGPQRRRFERILVGAGRVVGVRFRPGGLRPLLGAPVSSITDRSLPAEALPGLDGHTVAAVAATTDLDLAVLAMEAALRPLLPPRPDPAVALADRAVTLLAEDRTLTRVTDLADRLVLSVRSVQRLFADYVGLGPGWVIRRYRLHEVAAQALRGHPVDWTEVAASLGYCDQAHLVRDFTATIGTSPARYAGARTTGPPSR